MEDENQRPEPIEENTNEEKRILKRLTTGFNGAVQGGKRARDQGDKAVAAVKLIKKAIDYSQDAQKLYWDNGKEQQKANPNFDRALEMCDRGIRMLDEAMADLPTTISAIMPIKEKIMLQKKDIELQRQGIIADASTLIVPVGGE